MSKSLSRKQLEILKVVQKGVPLAPTPYADMAGQAGMELGEFMDVLHDWQKQSIIRRAGAIVNHFRVGVAAGTMVAWDVADDRVEQVGNVFASFAEVSHAYERPRVGSWRYNIFTMVHGETPEQVDAAVCRMSEKSGITEFRKLQTVREMKKTPPVYVKGDLKD